MANYKFEARLDNVDLSKSQVKEINDAINAAVGKVVVKAGLNRKGIFGNRLILNPEWYGIWWRRFDNEILFKNSKLYNKAVKFQ